MQDHEIIESKLRFLREYLEDLAPYRGIEVAAYRTSKKDQRFIERTLHLACECCIDVASHIVSRRGFREAKDNKDLFVILYENGIIRPETEIAMVKMARFRNIVVHDYARIDPEIVIGILRRGIDDFKAFSSDIIGFLDGPNPA